MEFFEILFSKKGERDFSQLNIDEKSEISTELMTLKTDPFPFKKRIKKIKGTKESLYRLRVDLKTESYRVFYSIIKPNQIIILRIIPKKISDRVLANLLH